MGFGADRMIQNLFQTCRGPGSTAAGPNHLHFLFPTPQDQVCLCNQRGPQRGLIR